MIKLAAVQSNPQHATGASQIHCRLSNASHGKDNKKATGFCYIDSYMSEAFHFKKSIYVCLVMPIGITYIYCTSVCVCVNAHVIMTFVYACIHSILCGPARYTHPQD